MFMEVNEVELLVDELIELFESVIFLSTKEIDFRGLTGAARTSTKTRSHDWLNRSASG